MLRPSCPLRRQCLECFASSSLLPSPDLYFFIYFLYMFYVNIKPCFFQTAYFCDNAKIGRNPVELMRDSPYYFSISLYSAEIVGKLKPAQDLRQARKDAAGRKRRIIMCIKFMIYKRKSPPFKMPRFLSCVI